MRKQKPHQLDGSSKDLIKQTNLYFCQRNIFITSISFLLNLIYMFVLYEVNSLSEQNKAKQTEIEQIQDKDR